MLRLVGDLLTTTQGGRTRRARRAVAAQQRSAADRRRAPGGTRSEAIERANHSPAISRALGRLGAELAGRLSQAGDDHFDTLARIWNAERQEAPAAIVECATPDDVVAAVRLARDAGLAVAVRGGGYGPRGPATCDGGLVIDMRSMRGVTVDRSTRAAVVEAGATWGDVDPATQQVGMAVPGLPIAGIGVAGSTTDGGYGHLRRAYGLACDNLLSAELVTAEGKRITTTGDRNPELLWGLRGGGGNFGVLTSLTFRLQPLPEPVMCGALLYPAERAGDLLRFYREYTATLRDDVTTRFSLVGAAHSRLVAETVGQTSPAPVVAISVACVGPPLEAATLVRPLRDAAPALLDLVAVRPYIDLQAGAGAAYPHGVPALVGSHFVGDLDDALLGAVVDRYQAMPAASCEIHIDHMGGKVGRVAQMSTAAPNRGAPYLISTMARWPKNQEGAGHREWHEGTEHRLRSHAVGGPHVGLTSASVPTEQVYGRERYFRLAALKARYDPDNVFALNQNVTPLS
jgi:hypothetical protein